ncbi:MAG: hypothetical protein J3Q66DRAFT_385881 [Benniella sp.]|nr:MAG: hypothetical protein J3Q66DRAFT_385881 [Benniella sp.]
MDLVYTWVNGSEPELDTMKAHYQALSPLFKNLKKLSEKHNRSGRQHRRGRGRKRDLGTDQTMNRFRDMNELKYSVRSVAQHAASGMFRKIFILTTEVVDSASGNKRGQVPQWLDLEKAKGMVELVPHRMVYDDENFLPSFNSLSIESQMHHIPGMADIFAYLNDDIFFAKPVSTADFWTPLYGFVFHAYSFSKISPYRPTPLKHTAVVSEEYSLEYINSILSQQFGARHRAYIAHIPHILSVPIMEEIQSLWPEEFKTTSSHRFRGEGKAFETQVSFLLAHYVMERLRETQLASWWKYRLDKNQDGQLDWSERQELIRMVEYYDQNKIKDKTGTRTWNGLTFPSFLEDYEERIRSVGIPWTNSTTYSLTGMDEYPFMLSSSDLKKSSKHQYTRPYATSNRLRMCKFEIDFCLGKDFRNKNVDTVDASTGKGSMFERLAFTEFHCGDCLLHIVRRVNPSSGMGVLLPLDRDSEAYGRVMRDLAKYNYVIGASEASFIPLYDGKQAQGALNALMKSRDNYTYICINDDVESNPAIFERVRNIFLEFMEGLFPIPSPWEKSKSGIEIGS